MIDFRYHLVSIVAVFLALGLGLLLGSTVLKPYVQQTLQRESKAEKRQIDSLLVTQSLLQRELDRSQQFAQAAQPQLLAHLLTGERVVMVAAPGSPAQVVTGVKEALTRDAGAVVTGEVDLEPSFLDNGPGTRSKLAVLAQQLAPPGMMLDTGNPITEASQVLAGAVLTKDGPGQPPAGQRDSYGTGALAGFAAGGFLTVSGQPADRATLAVVITPANPPSQDDSNPASQALVTLATQLQQAGQGTVAAGQVGGSGPGSAIDVIRAGGRAGKVSTVDNADYPIGQIVTVQALYLQSKGLTGNYGWDPSTGSAAPSPAPSASPTATPTRARGRHPAATATPARQATP